MRNRIERSKVHRQLISNSDVAYVRCAELTVAVLFQSKWSVRILCPMRNGPVRLGQLARLVPEASKKMLSQNLRKLEADGIVARKDLSDVVLHVEYELNEGIRETVCSLLDSLADWGAFYLDGALKRPGDVGTAE